MYRYVHDIDFLSFFKPGGDADKYTDEKSILKYWIGELLFLKITGINGQLFRMNIIEKHSQQCRIRHKSFSKVTGSRNPLANIAILPKDYRCKYSAGSSQQSWECDTRSILMCCIRICAQFHEIVKTMQIHGDPQAHRNRESTFDCVR